MKNVYAVTIQPKLAFQSLLTLCIELKNSYMIATIQLNNNFIRALFCLNFKKFFCSAKNIKIITCHNCLRFIYCIHDTTSYFTFLYTCETSSLALSWWRSLLDRTLRGRGERPLDKAMILSTFSRPCYRLTKIIVISSATIFLFYQLLYRRKIPTKEFKSCILKPT